MKKLTVAALIGTAVLASPAEAKFRVGMSDQDGAMFDNPHFQSLNVQKIRYIVPYDWFKNAGQHAEVIGFMNRAQQAGADVLVHFSARRGCYNNGRYSRRKVCRAPSVKTYKRNVRRFMQEYSWVTTYGAWNEVNHTSQPTHGKPKLAARYFLALRGLCRSCTIVAADVLDDSSMAGFLRGFDRYDKGKARIFGLHNYADVNRRRSAGLRRMLSMVPGEVWLTETGGIYQFGKRWPPSQKRQANRTKYMFTVANAYDSRRSGMRSRITRLYNYQWSGAPRSARFDAGLVNVNGTPRKAFRTFKKLAANQLR